MYNKINKKNPSAQNAPLSTRNFNFSEGAAVGVVFWLELLLLLFVQLFGSATGLLGA